MIVSHRVLVVSVCVASLGACSDPLRSEGATYAEHLKAAGVPVDYALYDGVTHEFFGMGAVVDKAKSAEERAAAGLREAFARQ